MKAFFSHERLEERCTLFHDEQRYTQSDNSSD